MPDLRLSKLPDRVPVKLTITVSPDLALALREYAAVYHAAYDHSETVEELVPFMLTDFLANDRGFAKARKEISVPPAPAPSLPRRGGRPNGSSAGGSGAA